MTLVLYVLRHAKAESAAPAGGGDHERPLRRRGRKNSRAIGRFLTGLGEAPELVLTSTAVRARETAEIAHAAGGWSAEIETRGAIYEATVETLLREVAACTGVPRSLILVGHQPGLSQLIAALTGAEPDFPTAALARIDLELEQWSAVARGCGKLAWLVNPETIAAFRARRKG